MTELKWWQKAVFYQIYPRSFADKDGDGIGDFHGMIDRLDYLQELGIDAVWLSPHYPSPLHDCGYDISDYTGVAPEYGTLDDFKRFLDGAHRRGIRVILDLVLNHTSDQHPWFIESRSKRENDKRDWYVWHDGVNGDTPNNWRSCFGGSAWEYDRTTDQFYYHYFFKEQPDLNWRNPEVKQAMWDAVRFWLDLGVDGFRLDAIGTIYEDPAMPDHPVKSSQAELLRASIVTEAENKKAEQAQRTARLVEEQHAIFQHQVDRPGVHELMQELRTIVDEYPDRVLIGETDDIAYYGDGENELHLVFNFPLMHTERITPAWVRTNQRERIAALPDGAWPCNTLGNHDSPRVYSRYNNGQNDDAFARLHLALMLTLRGTPFLYNGEEIGMTDLESTDGAQFRDNISTWIYRTAIDELGLSVAEALAHASRRGRDKCRTPMHWADEINAGFCPAGVQPWLTVNPNYAERINVADQTGDPVSLLNFYRRMLRLRKQTPALITGDYTVLHDDAEDYLAFLRSTPSVKGEGQTCLVVLNMSDRAHTLRFDLDIRQARPLFSSHRRNSDKDYLIRLVIAPFEIYIGEIF